MFDRMMTHRGYADEGDNDFDDDYDTMMMIIIMMMIMRVI